MSKIKKESYRTSMPEILYPGTGLSTPTEKSIMPFNNVHTIWDVLTGNQYEVPGAGGDWGDWSRNEEKSPGSYKEDGDMYKRRERDLEILLNLDRNDYSENEVWKVKVPGGYKNFSSLESAQRYSNKAKEKGIHVKWISRIAQATRSKAVDDSLEKTFLVKSKDYLKRVEETGSAFCISKNLFVTCAHVIKNYDKTIESTLDFNRYKHNVKVSLRYNNVDVPAEVIDFDGVNDLALLRANIDCKHFSFNIISSVGQEVVCVGSPHGYENNVTFGNINSLNRVVYSHNNAPKYMFVDCLILPGNSGGPIIDSEEGKLLGMVTAIVSEPGGDKSFGLNCALDSSYIASFCKKNGVKINL